MNKIIDNKNDTTVSKKEKLATVMKPKEVVEYLDQYVIGQSEAKKAVAVALRNRWRRIYVEEKLRDEIIPKNIMMIGATGVGKTEISRRIAKMLDAPFIKVEATKFTEVGYVGKDVESIIRDLVEVSMRIVKKRASENLESQAKEKAYERILDALLGDITKESLKDSGLENIDNKDNKEIIRKLFKEKLLSGELDLQEIEIEVEAAPKPKKPIDMPGDIAGGAGNISMGFVNISEMLGKIGGGKANKKVKTTLSIEDALKKITQEEIEVLLEGEDLVEQAVKITETEAVVFIDEIDKICSNGASGGGGRAEISREGVQRDLLPLVEGTIVSTKYGMIKTDHILFISSGSFFLNKTSDLIPELQGRFPVKVHLKSLRYEDILKIIKNTEASLPKQYKALMEVEDITIEFTDCAYEAIARLTVEYNSTIENIGARRLFALFEKLFEDIAYDGWEETGKKIVIDKEFVEKKINLDKDKNYIDLKNSIL